VELRDAIDQLTVIRSQLARTERLRCLRAVPVAFSAVLALIAALAQSCWIADPTAEPMRYLILWVGSAVTSMVAAAMEMAFRVRRSSGTLASATTLLAWEQFAPALFAGAALTTFVATRLGDQLWLLPGLWQMLFGLGILAAWRLLPGLGFVVGAFFLLSGTSCLWLGQQALEPWAMGVPFTLGQLVLSAILYWQLERDGELA
jgi:hypothetical protein